MASLLDQYKEAVGPEIIYELSQMARVLKGIKIVHVNSTKSGGGVAEILMTMTHLTAALGNRGLKVLVRGQLHPTLADLQLNPPEELFAFLDRWKTEIT